MGAKKKVFKPRTMDEVKIKLTETMAEVELLRKALMNAWKENFELKDRINVLEFALRCLMKKCDLEKIRMWDKIVIETDLNKSEAELYKDFKSANH